MSIRCGKCKDRHETTAQVRECYALAAPRTDSPSDAANRLAATVMTALRPAQVAQEAPAAPAPTEPGFYSTGAATYRLAPTLEWSKLLSNGRFATGCSVPQGARRMSVEEVAAQGRIHVRCIVCGITLKNPKSRALGIGPVCRGYV